MVRKKILASLGLALAFSFSAAPLALAADKAVPFDEFAGTDKAVYDNAKRDGLSNAEASAKAG